MDNLQKKIEEKLAEKMHIWYLEATKELNPKSYNPDAQKKYSELTEEQKFIDRYIAKKTLKTCRQEITEEIRNMNLWSKGTVEGTRQDILAKLKKH